MRKATSWIVISSLSAASCASHSAVKPDEMSAQGHREEAGHERQLAEAERDQYRPDKDRPVPGTHGFVFDVSMYNPTQGHLVAAAQHDRHARQHEAAAKALERFEEGECGKFPPATRAACPLLGPVAAIEDAPHGVHIRLEAGVNADAVVAHMRCHYAYARARAFSENVTCPIYVRGVSIERGREPGSIDLSSDDPAVARELGKRAREEAVFVKPAGG